MSEIASQSEAWAKVALIAIKSETEDEVRQSLSEAGFSGEDAAIEIFPSGHIMITVESPQGLIYV